MRVPSKALTRYTGASPSIPRSMRAGGPDSPAAASAASGPIIPGGSVSGGSTTRRSASLRRGKPTYIITAPDRNQAAKTRAKRIPSQRWPRRSQRRARLPNLLKVTSMKEASGAGAPPP